MKENKTKKIIHPEDDIILLITGKTVSEVISTYEMKEVIRLRAILTFEGIKNFV